MKHVAPIIAVIASIIAVVALLLASAANAAIPNIPASNGMGGNITCTVVGGDRQCAGIFTTFDGAPIDINVAFPPAPGSGPDGDFPIVGVFHGWGGTKLGFASVQEWLDAGYAVFSMSDRGWGNSCGGTDINRLLPVCAEGYNHLMDTRFEVRDAQEVFEALADRAAEGAVSGEGLIDPQAIAATGGSYGGGISMSLGALRNRKMLPDGSLVAWVSAGGKAMQIAATQPDIPWTDLAYALTPNGHTLDYVADAPYMARSRIGVMKQSFVAGLYGIGLALSNYSPPLTDPDADLTQWFAAINAGEPYDQNPLSQDITDEVTSHHSSYYIDDAVAPAPMLISNGWTDDLFPPDEAIRFYNRTRANHPGTPIALIFTDHGHQRGQNKGPDGTFRARQRRTWLDFYVRGQGPPPFLGVQTLTQTCGAASGGATGPFDDPDTDLPFQAATWAALAPGEVRLESAAAQTILPAVPTDLPVGQAFDPITGPGACASASATDQAGAATYRMDPAPVGGFTLMGSPTVVADILSPGPTSQIAGRLLDVDANGMQTLVARGLYRPEINTSATCQVFQLHPNGWKFEEGHVAKLELLPADQPYGRNSNGQLTVTVSNLRLRLPVLEAPGGIVQAPSPKVLPVGYALAVDVTTGIDATCPAPGPTTTTSTVVPATTSTTSTTSTTLPENQGLHVTRVRLREGIGSASVRVHGDFPVPPAITVPPSFTVRVQDSSMLDQVHEFNACTSRNGRIRCKEETSGGVFRAVIRPYRGAANTLRFRVVVTRQTFPGPFTAPVTMHLTHNSAVVRSDGISTCTPLQTGLRCRE
jgi:predicted acyl esterase